mmetsp:Transcript_96239/g.296759  ORF Transcript_96239/g.296759 Transcript_96239/m.296759 type:complete len:387 (+) Transcript_96239:636-1796(+)
MRSRPRLRVHLRLSLRVTVEDLALVFLGLLRSGLSGLLGEEPVASSQPDPPELEPAEGAEEEQEDDHAARDGGVEERREAEEEGRCDDKGQKDVAGGSRAVEGRVQAEQAGGGKGDLAHDGDREPDQDPNDVEEEVAERDVDRVGGHLGQGCNQGGDRRANVRPQREWQHLLQEDESHAAERGQGRRGDRAGLHHDGDAEADQEGEIVVHVCGLCDDPLRSAHEERLEALCQAEETESEEEQREDERNDAPTNVTRAFEDAALDDRPVVDILCVVLASVQVALLVPAAGLCGLQDVVAALREALLVGLRADLLEVLVQLLADAVELRAVLTAGGHAAAEQRSGALAAPPLLDAFGGVVVGRSLGEAPGAEACVRCVRCSRSWSSQR